jgi:hypothetical protein
MLGGIAIDLWRVLGARRELVAAADAAALGGADALDMVHLRATGDVRLDPADAERRALELVDDQGPGLGLVEPPRVVADSQEVTVRLEGGVELGLIRMVLGPDVIEIVVEASARPLVRP